MKNHSPLTDYFVKVGVAGNSTTTGDKSISQDMGKLNRFESESCECKIKWKTKVNFKER